MQLAYDGLNRPTLVTDPLSHTIGLTYDAANRLTGFSDLNGNATQYSYTGFGDNTQLTSPDTGTSTDTYDNASNTLTDFDARSKTTTFSYPVLVARRRRRGAQRCRLARLTDRPGGDQVVHLRLQRAARHEDPSSAGLIVPFRKFRR